MSSPSPRFETLAMNAGSTNHHPLDQTLAASRVGTTMPRPSAPGILSWRGLRAWCPAQGRLTVEGGVIDASLSWPRPPAGDPRGPFALALLHALVAEAHPSTEVAVRGADVVLRWRTPAAGVRHMEIDLRIAAEAHTEAIEAIAQAALGAAARAVGLPDDVRTLLACQHVGAHAGDLLPMVW